MADFVLDLKKDGKEFSVLANSYCEQPIVNLPNDALGRTFRDELNEVYKYLFGEEFPLGEGEYSYLISYRDGRFNKVYYPCIVRGNPTNEEASDPNQLYFRWGMKFYPLFINEEKKGNKKVITFHKPNGEEIDADIVGYPFNGAKYIDPALSINFINEEDDSYTIHFPIKVVPAQDLKDGEEVDYVAQLKSALKRGKDNFIELIAESKEYKALGKAINATELEVGRVYEVNDYVVTTSKQGKSIIKLILSEEIKVDGESVVEIWCPYSLANYLKSNPNISPYSPARIVSCGIEEQVSKSNGKTYYNARLALQHPDSKLLVEGNCLVGDLLEPEEMDEIYHEAEELVIKPFRYPPTYSDRDLDENVDYQLARVDVRETSKGKLYKLNLIDPRDDKEITIWCPNNLIPTINRMGDIDASDRPIFKVVSKTQRNDKTYAHSILDMGTTASEDTISLSFL